MRKEHEESLREAKKETKKRQKDIEKERERDRIEDYKRTSESASRSRARDSAEKKQINHDIAVFNADLHKREREIRNAREADVHGIEVYRANSQYKKVADARRSHEFMAVKKEQAESLLDTKRRLKAAQRDAEEERRHEERRRNRYSSDTLRERKEQDMKLRKEYYHNRAAAETDSNRLKKSLLRSQEEHEAEAIQNYKERRDYMDRKNLDQMKQAQLQKHQEIVSLVHQRKEMKEAQQRSEDEFNEAHMLEGIKTSEYNRSLVGGHHRAGIPLVEAHPVAEVGNLDFASADVHRIEPNRWV